MRLKNVRSVAPYLVKGVVAFDRLRGLTLLISVVFFVETQLV
jgi:hypothetical protein